MSTTSFDAMEIAKYELTARLAPFLDRHMILPLLDFSEQLDLFPSKDIQRSRVQLLEKTNMVDFYNEKVRELGESGIEERPRESVVENMDKHRMACGGLIELLGDKKRVAELRERNEFTSDHLRLIAEVTEDQVEALYSYAKLTFDCGRYHDAAEYLFFYRILSRNESNRSLALWGQLAADILLAHWDDALEGIGQMNDAIDAMNDVSQLAQLQMRNWLMHWSLFVYFNHENGRNALIELFSKEKYLNAIQTSCPHLLRYLTTAVLISRRRRNLLSDLVKIIATVEYAYSDPITRFVKSLLTDSDFDAAQQHLIQSKVVLRNDFFLDFFVESFIDSANALYFETYLRTYSKVSIKTVATTLGCNIEPAEQWIVNLVRQSDIDATIDSYAEEISVAAVTRSPFEVILSRTKNLKVRTAHVLANVSRKYVAAGEGAN